jgi:hypothetical protein
MMTEAEVLEIMNSTDIFNSYNVTFVFDYTTISTCVFAMHEDACADMAADLIYDDLGIHPTLLDEAQDIVIELLDENVL